MNRHLFYGIIELTCVILILCFSDVLPDWHWLHIYSTVLQASEALTKRHPFPQQFIDGIRDIPKEALVRIFIYLLNIRN